MFDRKKESKRKIWGWQEGKTSINRFDINIHSEKKRIRICIHRCVYRKCKRLYKYAALYTVAHKILHDRQIKSKSMYHKNTCHKIPIKKGEYVRARKPE